MTAYMQTMTADGRRPLQDWDRMSTDDQDAVRAHLRGEALTTVQRGCLDMIGTPIRIMRADPDGEMVTECLVTGALRKGGRDHTGPRPSDNIKNGLPPPERPGRIPNSTTGRGDMSGNHLPRGAAVGAVRA